MPKPEETPSSWIFVSHSNMDLDEVRRVRNALEEMGHNPLLFFLKCMNDDDELDDLIVREINARDFFLLCDSENARRSRKVSDEREWIKKLKDKVYQEVDLEADWQSQLAAIKELSIKATIFVSYQFSDQWFVDQLTASLRRFDYRVITDVRSILQPGQDWKSTIHGQIDEALDHGFVLVVLTENSLRSKAVLDETLYALARCERENRAGVVPVVIGDPGVVSDLMRDDPDWSEMLQRHWLILDPTSKGFDDGVSRLVDMMRSAKRG